MRRLAGAPLAHQLLIARLLVGLLKGPPDPLAHLSKGRLLSTISARRHGSDWKMLRKVDRKFAPEYRADAVNAPGAA